MRCVCILNHVLQKCEINYILYILRRAASDAVAASAPTGAGAAAAGRDDHHAAGTAAVERKERTTGDGGCPEGARQPLCRPRLRSSSRQSEDRVGRRRTGSSAGAVEM